jgi:hypothetical protein
MSRTSSSVRRIGDEYGVEEPGKLDVVDEAVIVSASPEPNPERRSSYLRRRPVSRRGHSSPFRSRISVFAGVTKTSQPKSVKRGATPQR